MACDLDDVRMDGFTWLAALGRICGGIDDVPRFVAFHRRRGMERPLDGWSSLGLGHHSRLLPQPPASLNGEAVPDISDAEKFAMLIMAVFTILFGVMPWIALDMMNSWTVHFFHDLLIPALTGGA